MRKLTSKTRLIGLFVAALLPSVIFVSGCGNSPNTTGSNQPSQNTGTNTSVKIERTPAGPDANGQPDLDGLKRQVEDVATATRNGDYGKIVDSTYPKLVELLGGRDKMLSIIDSGMTQVRARGFEILSYSVESPKDVQVINGQTFAVVPTLLKLKGPGNTVTSPGYMLGISSDGGKKWWLVDGSDLDEAKVKTLFPEASDKLVLPKRQPPVIDKAP